MPSSLGVLITYHNERELLAECLASLLQGKARPEEILIYDDASDYPAKEYVPAGCPVRIVRGDKNQGPSVGRNVLLRQSQSAYVHFQDADDLFVPEWAARVREVMDQKNPEAIFTDISSFRSDGRRSEKILAVRRIAHGGDLLHFCLQGPLLVPAGTYRRELVLAIGGYKESRWQSEDFDFHVRLARRGVRFEVIDEPLILIRVRAESRSQNSREVWSSTLASLEEFSRELPAAYQSDLAEAAAMTGAMLYRAGERSKASSAFHLAERLGPPTYGRQWIPYRWIARGFGAEMAEIVLYWYHRLFPEFLRPWFHGSLSRVGGNVQRDTFF